MFITGKIGLIEDDELGNIARSFNSIQNRMNSLDLANWIGVRSIDNVKDHIGLADFFQGRTEGLNKLGRKARHKANGV